MAIFELAYGEIGKSTESVSTNGTFFYYNKPKTKKQKSFFYIKILHHFQNIKIA
jgi:hypothetical protein